jgi:hypothetical protein
VEGPYLIYTTPVEYIPDADPGAAWPQPVGTVVAGSLAEAYSKVAKTIKLGYELSLVAANGAHQ